MMDQKTRQGQAERKLRQSLRVAFEEANKAGWTAADNRGPGVDFRDVGVYGLVRQALELMGEDVERFDGSCEWAPLD